MLRRIALHEELLAEKDGKKPETDDDAYVVGEDIPLAIQNLMKEPIYDMILVERYSAPPKTVGGIILPPGPEGKDRRKLAKVLAIRSLT